MDARWNCSASGGRMESNRVYTLTCTWAESYGAVLQAFALARAINDLGWDTRIVNYQPAYDRMSWRRRLLAPIYRPRQMKFLRESGLLTEDVYRDRLELEASVLAAEALVVGSDQVWNCTKYHNGRDDAMFLRFGPSNARRVAYAASLAMPAVPPDQVDRYRRLLSEFDAISVREATGARALREIGVENAGVVVDPVFLVDRDEWTTLANRSERGFSHRKYVLVICLEERDAVYEYAKEKATRLGVELYSLTTGPRGFKKPPRVDQNFRDISVQDYLAIVLKAEAVVTDSFHATSFSLIFNRDVDVLLRDDSGNSRMVDLLNDLAIGDRTPTSGTVIDDSIDFESVNRLIEAKVVAARRFLGSAVAGSE